LMSRVKQKKSLARIRLPRNKPRDTMGTMDKEEAAVKIAELIRQKSDFQEEVGKLVLSIHDIYGKHQTDDLSALVEEQGETMSSSSMRQYAWVTKSSKELNLPDDLDFSTKRQIINSPHKKKYLKMIERGDSAKQLKRQMAIDNKVAKTKCTGYCKQCSKEVDVKNHHCQDPH